MLIELLKIRTMPGSSVKNDLYQLSMELSWCFIMLSGLSSLKGNVGTLVLGILYYRVTLGLKVKIKLSHISMKIY